MHPQVMRFRQPCPTLLFQSLTSSTGPEAGAAALLLNSPSWKLLLSRIGDTLMLYLLLHCSLFLQMNNGGLVQLSGYCMAAIARAAVFGGSGAAAAAPGGNARGEALRTGKRRRLEAPGDVREASGSGEPCAAAPDSGAASPPPEEGCAAQQPAPRPARLSSWKRRKLALQRTLELPGTQDVEGGGEDVASANLATPSELPPTRPKQPKAQKRPELPLPRQMIFYSATFPSQAGLPQRRACE